MEAAFFFPDTNLVEILELRQRGGSGYENDATVTATVRKADNTVLAGPVALAYVAASNGHYRATVNSALMAIAVGDRVTLQYDITDSDGNSAQRIRRLPVRARP